jgi:hypothetical protein
MGHFPPLMSIECNHTAASHRLLAWRDELAMHPAKRWQHQSELAANHLRAQAHTPARHLADVRPVLSQRSADGATTRHSANRLVACGPGWPVNIAVDV